LHESQWIALLEMGYLVHIPYLGSLITQEVAGIVTWGGAVFAETDCGLVLS